MAKQKKGRKGWEIKGGFVALPFDLLSHPNYINLTYPAKSLLIEIARQYKGKNNGDLSATWTMMKKRGWRSKSTLAEKLKELLTKGFIEKTRHGGLHKCCLYAITWHPIDDCKGKLDVLATNKPSSLWKNNSPTR